MATVAIDVARAGHKGMDADIHHALAVDVGEVGLRSRPHCNGGDLVGGACAHDDDCVHRCVEGGDFPEGTCSVPCDDDFDCPDGTACIDKAEGVCLLRCHEHLDCRAGYQCDDKDRRGHEGDAFVCIED